MSARRVPVAVLRAEVEAAGFTPLELAKALGWRHKGRTCDTERVKRTLGLLRHAKGHGYDDAPRKAVNAATAERIRSVLSTNRATMGGTTQVGPASVGAPPGRDTEGAAPPMRQEPNPRTPRSVR